MHACVCVCVCARARARTKALLAVGQMAGLHCGMGGTAGGRCMHTDQDVRAVAGNPSAQWPHASRQVVTRKHKSNHRPSRCCTPTMWTQTPRQPAGGQHRGAACGPQICDCLSSAHTIHARTMHERASGGWAAFMQLFAHTRLGVRRQGPWSVQAGGVHGVVMQQGCTHAHTVLALFSFIQASYSSSVRRPDIAGPICVIVLTSGGFAGGCARIRPKAWISSPVRTAIDNKRSGPPLAFCLSESATWVTDAGAARGLMNSGCAILVRYTILCRGLHRARTGASVTHIRQEQAAAHEEKGVSAALLQTLL